MRLSILALAVVMLAGVGSAAAQQTAYPAQTIRMCVKTLEVRHTPAHTVILGTGAKEGGGTVQFYATQAGLAAQLDGAEARAPQAIFITGWNDGSAPETVRLFTEAVGAHALVEMELGRSSRSYQPVERMAFHYDAACH